MEGAMVEYHAWATVLPEGDSLRISQSLLEELRRRVEEISLGSGFGQIRASNGDQHLFLTGQPKHRSAEIEDLLAVAVPCERSTRLPRASVPLG